MEPFPKSAYRRLKRVLLAWSVLLLASFSHGASVYPVRFGPFEKVFGVDSSKIEDGFARRKKREFIPFVPSGKGLHPEETCYGCASFDEKGFVIGLLAQGTGRDEIGECGGTISLSLYPSVTNRPGNGAPILLNYSLERFPRLDTAMPTLGGVNNENAAIHSDPVRYSFETASYGNSNVRVLSSPPEVAFYPLERGWAIFFSFRWLDFQERLPFSEGKYPEAWRLVATRRDGGGRVASWGTPSDPVLLGWGRPGDDFIDQIPLYYFMNLHVGKAYRDIAGFIRSDWTTSRQEKWMGYLDPGIPTFEKKNPESDALFYRCQVAPLLDANANIDKAIYYNVDTWNKEYVPKPAVADFTKAERRAVVSGLDRILFIGERVDQARRDYLNARFLDEPPPVRSAPAEALPGRRVAPEREEKSSLDDLSLEDLGAPEIELDDVVF